MEIGLTKKDGLQVLTLKGTFRLQNWKVVDKHLETLLDKGCRNLVVDLSGVTFLCSAGVAALLQDVKTFQDRQGRLILLSTTAYVHQVLEASGGKPFLAENVFPDWRAVEKYQESRT